MDGPRVAYRPGIVIRGLHMINRTCASILPRGLYLPLAEQGFRCVRALRRGKYRLATALFYQRRPHDLEKRRAVARYMPHSLVGASGLEETYTLSQSVVENLSGDLVECGVAQGGAAALMGLALKGRTGGRRLWLFDSFEGLPAASPNDFSGDSTGDHLRDLPPGSCLGTEADVRRLILTELGLRSDQVEFVRGWFEDTIPTTVVRMRPISFLRIDADWYDSVRLCLEVLYEHVESGGVVVIDDYSTCHGARKALDEFLGARGLVVDLKHDGRGGCSFRVP